MTAFEIPGGNYLGEAFAEPTQTLTAAGLTIGDSVVARKTGIRPLTDVGIIRFPNPGFETGADYWYQGTLDTAPFQSTDQYHQGAASLKLTQNVAGADKSAFCVLAPTGGTESANGIPVRANAPYLLGAWSKIVSNLTGAGELRLRVIEFNSGGTTVGDQYVAISKTAHDWQTELFKFVTGATTARISVRVTFENVAGAVYLDDFELGSGIAKASAKAGPVDALSITATVAVKRSRAVTDTGLTLTSSVKPTPRAQPVSVGITLTDATRRGVTRVVTATGLTLVDKLVPYLTPAGPLQPLLAGGKRVSLYHFERGRLPKVAVFCDSRAAGEYGNPRLRAVVYARDEATGAPSALLAAGVEVTIPNGSAPGWVDLPLWHDPVVDPIAGGDPRGALLAHSGYYFVGLYVAGSNALRVFQGIAPQPDVAGDDPATDRPTDPFGASSTVKARLLLNVPRVVPAWAPPANADDFYCATLPFPEAQKRFTLTGPAAGTLSRIVSVSWHGTQLDGQRGSFAVLGRDSGLGDLLGRRVRLTLTSRKATRSVSVYVHNELPLRRGELSLSRRAFGQLAELGEDEVAAVIEVLA